MPQPCSMLESDVNARIVVCTERPTNLHKYKLDPKLLHQHLRERLGATIDKSDGSAINTIKGIFRTEVIRRRWRDAKPAIKPKRRLQSDFRRARIPGVFHGQGSPSGL